MDEISIISVGEKYLSPRGKIYTVVAIQGQVIKLTTPVEGSHVPEEVNVMRTFLAMMGFVKQQKSTLS